MWKVNNLDSKLKNLQQTPERKTYPMTVNYLFYEGISFIFVFWWYLKFLLLSGFEYVWNPHQGARSFTLNCARWGNRGD